MNETPSVTVPVIGLRTPEAAAALGISPRKLAALIADRTSGIPFARLGGTVVFPARELADWLAGQATRRPAP